MRDWLTAAARRRPDQPYLVTAERSLTFEETDQWVARMAGGLRRRGVGPGSPVAVWARNEPDTVAAMFAVVRAGGVVVLLDPRLTPVEARERASAAGAMAGVGVDLPDLGVPVFEAGELEDEPWRTSDLDLRRTAWVVFTSGSAGAPKGVRLTVGNLEASAKASADHLGHREDDRWLAVLPLAHVGGASIPVRAARQATPLLLEPTFDPERTASLLARGESTLASLVAVMLRRILDVHPGPYRGVRAVLVGGGPVPPDLVEAALAAGLPALPTYGMTETASQVATTAVGERFLMAVPGAELRIVDGRIQVRGQMVSPGYLGEPDRDPEEWFETGDLGEVNPNGSLEVLGRADEVIVTGAENVHPGEVEAVLRTHPAVTEAVVVGVPDPVWGERVVALYEGTAGPGELDRHARYRLAGYKVPRRWVPVEELPRTSLGKVDRRAAAELAHSFSRTERS